MRIHSSKKKRVTKRIMKECDHNPSPSRPREIHFGRGKVVNHRDGELAGLTI